jgi:hypothetical protein
MEPTSDLYQAILARRSVRRYENRPLSPEAMAQVRAILSQVKPLVPENHFEVLVRDVEPGEDLTAALGGYGRIVSPPHYLVPYVVGPAVQPCGTRTEVACVPLHGLTDLGYRTEQIAVQLTRMGIGSCYIGSLGREKAARSRRIADSAGAAYARIGAFLVFGHPATGLAGRALNAAMRRAVGATNKLPAERIFFRRRADGTFDHPAAPPDDLAPLIEAARSAPSADNAQPWRFVLADTETLYLLVRRKNPRYGPGPRQEYRLYDGGICMGNVSLAMEALGMAGSWSLLAEGDPDLPDHPADLQPLARLRLM